MEGTFWRLSNLPNTQAEHPSITQSTEANQLQDTFLETVQNSPETPPLQADRGTAMPRRDADTQAIWGKREVVPQQSGMPDRKLQEEERREMENGTLNIRSSIRTLAGTCALKRNPLKSLVLAQRWAP